MLSQTIDEIIEGLLSSSLHGKNHDVYEKRLTQNNPPPKWDYVPHCIYFYYVRIDRDGKVRVDHYLYANSDLDHPSTWPKIPHSDVPGILRNLALNGRPSTGRKDPPKLPSNNFDEIPWNRRCYIAIFFDEANWSFHKRADGKSGIVFNPSQGMPNHTFFDAMDVELELPNGDGGTDKRTAIFFVNHYRKNDQGDDLDERQEFKFDMWLTAKFAESNDTGMVVIFDPGGTNDGPPEQP